VEILLVLFALVAGAGLPVQAGVNSALARHAGRPEWAAFISFAVGLAALGAWLVASRTRPPGMAELGAAPGWAWSGGVIGAVYVTATILLAPRLGLAAMLALSVAGQMTAALLLDRLGAMGLAARPITPGRVLGAALLVAGVVLVRR
jgi:transporter family-2 protein